MIRRVRQALAMAVDQPLIAKTFYGGNAVVLVYPVAPVPEYQHMYVPLEQLPQVVKEMFEYHPDKAKQLLAEAGYPNGFKCETPCIQSQVDMLSIIKDYWAKVGVNLELRVKEYATWTSLGFARSYNDMYVRPSSSAGVLPFSVWDWMPGNPYNFCNVNDPVLNKAYVEIQSAWPDEVKRSKLRKDAIPYELDQAYILCLPWPYIWTFWQPWVKNYQGEINVGRKAEGWPMYIWIDQDLKEKMTGTR